MDDLIENVGIFIMNADGSGIRQVTQKTRPSIGEDSDPQWSPDGREIVFQRFNVRSALPSDGVVVHMSRVRGRRVVTSVREYADYRDGTVTSAELWRFDPRAARAVRTEVDATDRLTAKLTAAGVDANLLDRDPAGGR